MHYTCYDRNFKMNEFIMLHKLTFKQNHSQTQIYAHVKIIYYVLNAYIYKLYLTRKLASKLLLLEGEDRIRVYNKLMNIFCVSSVNILYKSQIFISFPQNVVIFLSCFFELYIVLHYEI